MTLGYIKIAFSKIQGRHGKGVKKMPVSWKEVKREVNFYIGKFQF